MVNKMNRNSMILNNELLINTEYLGVEMFKKEVTTKDLLKRDVKPSQFLLHCCILFKPFKSCLKPFQILLQN